MMMVQEPPEPTSLRRRGHDGLAFSSHPLPAPVAETPQPQAVPHDDVVFVRLDETNPTLESPSPEEL